jgi:PD-(D/E)XK nuclease superfamily protein
MYWLASKGAHIWLPVATHPDCDLIAETEGRLVRVQVKTSNCWYKRRWSVALCTRGGNQSWSGLVKRLDPSRCDYVFVLVGDGRQWFIPSDQLGGDTAILIGGPKYARFEVESGQPLPHERPEEPASTIGSSDARGDVRVAKGARL